MSVLAEMDALVAYLQVLGTMVDVNKWRREKYGAR
jgi:cbb3-type cytochrome oxidase cytochrome c subunit